MKTEQLEEISNRAEKATEGPWDWDEESHEIFNQERLILSSREYLVFMADSDAEFIAHAREDIPNLLDEVERLREALKTVESWTRNPREYEPSYYSINHVARTALGGDEQ